MKRSVVPESSSALYLLFAEGFCFLVIAVAVIACGFVLNYHHDFDYDQVNAEHDYTQYWVGFVLLITAFFAIAAGTRQRNRWLVINAMCLFFLSILVSLFALVIEGNDWIRHKNNVRRKGFWESEDYDCTSPSSTSCICNSPSGGSQLISGSLDCKTLDRLDYLYGGLVCCILAGVFLALSSIIIVMIFIPIRSFTVPVPRKRIKKITVLEEKPEPVVVYKPAPKRVVEPKPKVEEIVIRERKPPPMRMVVEPRPEPKTEVEEIVIRERQPRQVRTIIYDQPQQQRPEVVYRLPRTRTLVYDEPRPEPRPVQTRPPVPIEPPPEPEKDPVYDVGRFARKVHPTPDQPGVEKDFIVNPNFRREATLSEPQEPEPVYYGRHEVVPPVRYVQQEPAPVRYVQQEPAPVRYVQQEPAPVRYVRREEPEQVRYVRKPTVVYERRPRVVEERALVPVRRARPKGHMIVHADHPKPSYIIRKPGHRPVVAIRRRRAYSDEGPGLLRAREVRPQPKRRVYTTQPHPPRTFTTGPEAPRVLWQRARANSDEGPRLYREPLQRERPTRIYTDKEIAMAGGYPPQAPSGAASPRVFTDENIATANMGNKPPTAHIHQAQNEDYDRILESNLTSADKWNKRPATPY